MTRAANENGLHFVPGDANFAERVRDSFDRQPAMRLLGAILSHVAPGLVRISLPYRDDLTQQHGFFHGGISGAIADSAGGYAGYSLMPADSSVLTVEYKINLLAPAAGDLLIATGQVLRPGRTLTTCGLRVEVVKDGKVTVCAEGLQTLMCLHGRPDTKVSERPARDSV